MTYKEHGDKLKALFISQIVLVWFLACCQVCAMQTSFFAAGTSMAGMMAKKQ